MLRNVSYRWESAFLIRYASGFSRNAFSRPRTLILLSSRTPMQASMNKSSPPTSPYHSRRSYKNLSEAAEKSPGAKNPPTSSPRSTHTRPHRKSNSSPNSNANINPPSSNLSQSSNAVANPNAPVIVLVPDSDETSYSFPSFLFAPFRYFFSIILIKFMLFILLV